MANSRLFIASITNLLNNRSAVIGRCNFTNLKRRYSVFPPNYIKPTFRKDEQETLFQTEDGKNVIHEQIKPALVTDTSSEFYDARVLKFINILMREGNKKLAISLVTKAFEGVKRIQLERYHKAKINETDEIELDPFVVFHRAVDNCTPVLHLIGCKKGGIIYQVPIPIAPTMAQHKSMTWLILAARERDDHKLRFYDLLAKELVTASQNQGRAVKWKQELHKKCLANRAYAHFRWL